MDLLPDVPSWGEIQHKLDTSLHNASDAMQGGWRSVQVGVDARLTSAKQSMHRGFDEAYDYVGGRKVDCLRRALAEAQILAGQNLVRQFKGIEIEQIINVLLKMAAEVALILAGSSATGAVLGGAIGALGFGVGAAPGAVAGGALGLEIGNLILAAMGLAVLAEYFIQGIPAVCAQYKNGIALALNAGEAGIASDGGNVRVARENAAIQRAAVVLAKAEQELIVLLLTAIVTYLMRGKIKESLVGAKGPSEAARSLYLQEQMRAKNKALAEWLIRNDRKLLAEQALQPKALAKAPVAAPKTAGAGAASPSQTMREFYAQQDPTFVSPEEQIAKAKTFVPTGVSNAQIDDYLLTPDGQKYLAALRKADPTGDAKTIYERAAGQLGSGATLPTLKTIDSPLIKIVPEGKTVPGFSPFFTTKEALQQAAASKSTLADVFGLPLTSEAPVYSIYEMAPLKPTEVFINQLAPTSEVGGLIQRIGGAEQYLIPNRGEWAQPVLTGVISN